MLQSERSEHKLDSNRTVYYTDLKWKIECKSHYMLTLRHWLEPSTGELADIFKYRCSTIWNKFAHSREQTPQRFAFVVILFCCWSSLPIFFFRSFVFSWCLLKTVLNLKENWALWQFCCLFTQHKNEHQMYALAPPPQANIIQWCDRRKLKSTLTIKLCIA